MFGLRTRKTDETWPIKIVGRRNARELFVTFHNGESGTIEAELLRVLSPSAEVKGHGSHSNILVHGKQNVTIHNLEPVGNYAVRIIFDDGHETGLYTWSFLLYLLRNKKECWKSYRNRLKTNSI